MSAAAQKHKKFFHSRLLHVRRSEVWKRDRLITDIQNNTHVICKYCSKKLTKKEFTLDHIIPISKGGSHDLSNLVVSCKPCNDLKNNMGEKEFDFWRKRNNIE